MKPSFSLLLPLVLAACSGDFSDLVPLTVEDDSDLPALELRDTTVHVQTFGEPSDPLVVFLHGGPGGDHRALLPLASLADRGYFTVFWDQRGAGLSKRHECDEITPEAYLADLEALIDHYRPERSGPVFFVGHSWGAMYATMFIDAYPDRVQAAVLAEPGGFTLKQVEALQSRLFDVSFFAESTNDALGQFRFLTPDDHERIDYLAGTSSDLMIRDGYGMGEWPWWRSGGVAGRCLAQNAGDFDWTTNLSSFDGEVLFVSGEKNTVHTDAQQESLASSYPNATRVTLPGVGHDMVYASSEEVVDLAADLFSRHL